MYVSCHQSKLLPSLSHNANYWPDGFPGALCASSGSGIPINSLYSGPYHTRSSSPGCINWIMKGKNKCFIETFIPRRVRCLQEYYNTQRASSWICMRSMGFGYLMRIDPIRGVQALSVGNNITTSITATTTISTKLACVYHKRRYIHYHWTYWLTDNISSELFN